MLIWLWKVKNLMKEFARIRANHSISSFSKVQQSNKILKLKVFEVICTFEHSCKHSLINLKV